MTLEKRTRLSRVEILEGRHVKVIRVKEIYDSETGAVESSREHHGVIMSGKEIPDDVQEFIDAIKV